MTQEEFIERFNYAHTFHYDNAYRELSYGKKETHWIWYIFPYVFGLGKGFVSREYCLKSLQEAHWYLNDPVIGSRFREICKVILNLNENNPEAIFSRIDAMKLCSSMTLFNHLEPNSIFQEVLDKYFQGQKDQLSLNIIAEMTPIKEGFSQT